MALFERKRSLRDDRRSRKQRRQRGALAPSRWGPFESLEMRLAPAVSVWSGTVSNLWSNVGNWDDPPDPGDDLVFPAGATNLSNVNDLVPQVIYGKLTIAGSGYTISGAGIALTGGIESSQPDGVDTVNLPIRLSQDPSVTVGRDDASLVLGGTISGTSGLRKAGDGVLDLLVANDYTGTTVVADGSLFVAGAQGGSPVTINAGAVLGGSGTVGTITSNAGTLRPGKTTPALLNDIGDLNLGVGSSFVVALNGTSAGSGYSQLAVAGRVNLEGATLSATAGFTATGNDTFTIIDNRGGQAVVGTFAGLPEGAPIAISGQPFRISYIGGTGNDVVLTRIVGTSTSLLTSRNSVVSGESVSLTATVAPVPGSTGTPSGSVRFANGSTILGTAPLSNGVATLPGVVLPAGNASITATFPGEGTFDVSTSPTVAVTVAMASTTTTVTTSPNPSNLGASVTITATVAVISPGAGTPTGTVEFTSGSTSLGAATLINGVATTSTTMLATGANPITARYLGDSNNAGSTSTAVTQTVNATVGTITTVAVSPSPSVFGQSVTLTAGVTSLTTGAGVPTGTAEFFRGTTSLGTATLSGGVASLSTTGLVAGINSITARYQGSATFAASTSSPILATVNQASTTTTLATAPNPSSLGQSVTLTATVAPVGPGSGTPAGSVAFMNGTTSLGTATLVNGVATLNTTSLPVGSSPITATYGGGGGFTGSASTAVVQAVIQGNASVTLTASKVNPVTTEAVRFTATVAAIGPATGTPTGTVDFFANGILFGSAELAGGEASLVSSEYIIGDLTITAVYRGDATFNGQGTSSPLSIVVGDNNELFLNRIYLDVFRRPINRGGVDHWLTLLVTGTPRRQVVRAILNSPQARRINLERALLGSTASAGRTSRALVNNLYEAILGRTATSREIRRSVPLLDRGAGVRRLVIALFSTNEFYASNAPRT